MKKMRWIFALLIFVMLTGTVSVMAETKYYGDVSPRMDDNGEMTATAVPGFAGKKNDDMVYALTGKALSGDNHYLNAIGATSVMGQITTECQFLLPDDSTSFKISPRFYTTSDKSGKTTMGIFEIKTTQNAAQNNSSVITENSNYTTYTANSTPVIEKNKWYAVALKFPSGVDNRRIYVYLNGAEVGYLTLTTDVYGVNHRIGYGPNAADKTVYLDNIHTYESAEYTFSYDESFPSAVLGTENVTVENNVVTVPYGTTVEQLTNIIPTTDGNDDVKRVYTNSEMTTEADGTALANGTTLVVAAKNGMDREMAYSYYTVAEAAPVDPDADVLKGNNTSDLSIADNTTDSTKAEIKLETAVYGKALDDAAYKFVKTNSNAYINYTCGHKNNTNSLVEFSFAKADAGDDFRLEINYYGDSGHTSGNRKPHTIHFKDGGIQWGDEDKTLYGQPFDTGKWYNVAVQFPTDATEETYVYVNGELAYTGSVDNGAYGLAYARFKNSTEKTFYLDNIRDAEEIYTPSKDAKANITVSNGIIKDDVIKMLSADADKIIHGENDALRMYKSGWTQVDNLSEADFVVVAAKNGRNIERTYTYLTKEIIPVIVNYNKVTEEDSAILNSELMANEEATLIVAWYKDNELIDLQTVPATLENGIYTAKNEVEVNNDYSYRIFVWNSVDGLKPLTKATDVK